jgi:hypothetical protein
MESKKQIQNAVSILCNQVDYVELGDWGQEVIRNYENILDERSSARDENKYMIRGSEQYEKHIGGAVAVFKPPYINVSRRLLQVPIVEKGRCGIYVFSDDAVPDGDYELAERVWLYGATCGFAELEKHE